MENRTEGFSPEPKMPAAKTAIAPQEEATLRNEFEIMQRLNFTFIKELRVNTAEDYIMEVTNLTYSMKNDRKQKTR
jgi:hypothetical protein